MNIQLLLQLLVHEALGEGIDLQAAHELKINTKNKVLYTHIGQENYCIRIESLADKARMRKKHTIFVGPSELDLTTHLSTLGRSNRSAVTFTCPTFGECTPDYAKFKGEQLDVMIDKVTASESKAVSFEGVAYIVTDKKSCVKYPNGYPIAGQPVRAVYNPKRGIGEMAPRRFVSIESYLC